METYSISHVRETIDNYVSDQYYSGDLLENGNWFVDKIGNDNEPSLEHYYVKVEANETIMGVYFSIEKCSSSSIELDIKGLSTIDTLMYNVSDLQKRLDDTNCERDTYDGYFSVYEDIDLEEFQQETGLIIDEDNKLFKLDSMVTIPYIKTVIPNRHGEDLPNETIYKFSMRG